MSDMGIQLADSGGKSGGQVARLTCLLKAHRLALCIMAVYALFMTFMLSLMGTAMGPSAPVLALPVASVTAFYEAVDGKDLAGIAKAASPNYVAVFGAGCSSVGGAEHCGEQTLSLAAFKSFVNGAPPKQKSLIKRKFTDEGSGIVSNHYTVGRSGAHGAAIHHVVDGVVTSSVWYVDQQMNVRIVEAFYKSIDSLGFKSSPQGFMALLDPAYVAVFGPGRAAVGGATWNKSVPEAMNATQLMAWAGTFPARCASGQGTSKCQTMQRQFAATASEVTNHYTVTGAEASKLSGKGGAVHGVATHRMREGKIVESFWYTHEPSDKCGPEVHKNSTHKYYDAVDCLTSSNCTGKAAAKRAQLSALTATHYVAVFSAGVSAVGGNLLSATGPTVLNKADFLAFLEGCSKGGKVGAAATCMREPEHEWCDAALKNSNCLQRNLTSPLGNTVSNGYAVKDAQGKVVTRGNAVHRFEGEKLVESFWYPSAHGHH